MEGVVANPEIHYPGKRKYFGLLMFSGNQPFVFYVFTFSPLVDTKAFGRMHATDAESFDLHSFYRGVCESIVMRFLLFYSFSVV